MASVLKKTKKTRCIVFLEVVTTSTTPLRYTTHMETTYQIYSRKNTENKETNALANKPKIQIKHRK